MIRKLHAEQHQSQPLNTQTNIIKSLYMNAQFTDIQSTQKSVHAPNILSLRKRENPKKQLMCLAQETKNTFLSSLEHYSTGEQHSTVARIPSMNASLCDTLDRVYEKDIYRNHHSIIFTPLKTPKKLASKLVGQLWSSVREIFIQFMQGVPGC